MTKSFKTTSSIELIRSNGTKRRMPELIYVTNELPRISVYAGLTSRVRNQCNVMDWLIRV